MELIKEKIDIVEFINSYLPLKKAGRNFRGLCPFHQEKTPSFFVSPERGFYHCFGCQKNGDIFTFLMEREGLTFPEALKILAERAGVKLSLRAKTPDQSHQKERLLALSLLAAEYYHHLLLSHRVGEGARRYLKKRGINAASIKNFKLGYAPDSWESTGKFLLTRGYQEPELIESGLIIPKERPGIGRGWYDRFRGRLMFPVFDLLGRVVGFSGRTLKEGPNLPKYINSPDSLIFQKGRLLYGLNLAKDSIRREDQTILVEGNLDVISTHQAGLHKSLAPLGTGFTEPQAKLIKRFTQNLILAFDNDDAGLKATLGAIQLALGLDLSIGVVKISNAKDPDEAVQKDAEQFKKDLEEAQNFFEYLLDFAKNKFSWQDTQGKSATAKLILPFLARVSDRVAKDGFLKSLANELKVEEKSVWANLEKIEAEIAKERTSYRGDAQESVEVSLPSVAQKPREQVLSEHLLILILALPEALWSRESLKDLLFNKISLQYLVDRKLRRIFESLVEVFIETCTIDPQKIARRLEKPDLQKEFDLLLLRGSHLGLAEDEFLINLEKTQTELELIFNKKRLKGLSTLVEKAEADGEPEKVKSLKSKMRELTKKVRR